MLFLKANLANNWVTRLIIENSKLFIQQLLMLLVPHQHHHNLVGLQQCAKPLSQYSFCCLLSFVWTLPLAKPQQKSKLTQSWYQMHFGRLKHHQMDFQPVGVCWRCSHTSAEGYWLGRVGSSSTQNYHVARMCQT